MGFVRRTIFTSEKDFFPDVSVHGVQVRTSPFNSIKIKRINQQLLVDLLHIIFAQLYCISSLQNVKKGNCAKAYNYVEIEVTLLKCPTYSI